jgi:hypothetical protein
VRGDAGSVHLPTKLAAVTHLPTYSLCAVLIVVVASDQVHAVNLILYCVYIQATWFEPGQIKTVLERHLEQDGGNMLLPL